jgi:hypothetical protein
MRFQSFFNADDHIRGQLICPIIARAGQLLNLSRKTARPFCSRVKNLGLQNLFAVRSKDLVALCWLRKLAWRNIASSQNLFKRTSTLRPTAKYWWPKPNWPFIPFFVSGIAS